MPASKWIHLSRWTPASSGPEVATSCSSPVRLVHPQQVPDLGQQLLVGGQRSGLRLLTAPAALGELVQRQHDDEVHGRGDEQEVEPGLQDLPDVEVGAVEREVPDLADVRLAEDRGDQRVDQVLHQRGDDRAERGADDDRDREVEDVPAHDEFLEALEHVAASTKRWLYPRKGRSAGLPGRGTAPEATTPRAATSPLG